MKVLHVTHRFGREVEGGSEYHLLMLSKALANLGVTIDVATTRTRSLRGVLRFGVRWDNDLRRTEEVIDGVNIHRFRCFNLPKAAMLLLCYILQRRWDIEEAQDFGWDDFDPDQEGCIGPGWHLPERHGATVLRWTKRRAQFVIADSATELRLTALCAKRIPARVLVDGKEVGSFRASRNWEQFRFGVTGLGRIHGVIEPLRLWRPLRDSRRLGIAVSDLSYSSRGAEKQIDLSDNYLFRRKREAVISSLVQRATSRPRVFDLLFTALRCPPSPGLISFVNRRADRYDLILGHMAPFGTINLAAGAAWRHARPLALLPLAHVDDDFYHWNSYYRAFKQADLILANSQYAVDQFYHRLGANAVAVGPGVDRADFEASAVSGKRFRQKHGLEEAPLILYVGRKNFLKRYDLLVKAVDLVNRDHPCKMVIIGLDEDHVSIASPNVLVLGPLPRPDLIDAYDACDVFGMMSESESFGMVFLEAWMRRKPVIGNRHCGAVASLIEDGVDGYLCENEWECAERVRTLLAHPSQARILGEHGFRKVIERFTWDQIGKRVLGQYEALLALRAARC